VPIEETSVVDTSPDFGEIRLLKIALAVMAACIGWAVHDAWVGLPLGGLAILGTCGFVALLLIKADFADLPRSYLLATIAMTLGSYGHFYCETPFLNVERQQSLSALTTVFLDIALEGPPYEHPCHVRELALQAVGFCSQQPLADAQTTAVEAMKLAYEPPALSVIDRVATPQHTGPDPSRCLQTYRQLRQPFPADFKGAESANLWLSTVLAAEQ
jgi:hypothetical protein